MTIAVAAFAIAIAFRSLLLDQSSLRIEQTADQISRTVDRSTGFNVSDLPVTSILINQANLEHWASPTTLVQVDDPQGNAIGKSGNMGSLTFAPSGVSVTGPVQTIRTVQTPYGEMLVLSRAIATSGRLDAVIRVAERLDVVRDLLDRARLILGVVAAGALVLVAIASLFIATAAIDPIERLTAAIDQIGGEHLDRRIGWSRRDEVGRLAATFDRMLDRLQEAFAREREFISDASHELKTPLTVINANAQLLQRWGDRDDEVRRESIEAIIGESAGLAGMINGMLILAKADAGESIPRAPLDLLALIDDVTRTYLPRAEAKGLHLVYERDIDSAVVLGDERLLRQLFTNLVDNAVKFTEGGSVVIRATGEGVRVRVDVDDTGIGMDEQALHRVFDRFYRSDKSRNRSVPGTGLGLAIARSIARVHDGTIVAALRPGGGTRFTVTLPLESVIIESS